MGFFDPKRESLAFLCTWNRKLCRFLYSVFFIAKDLNEADRIGKSKCSVLITAESVYKNAL